MKRLALFLDGTWNDPEDNTNVSRLKALTSDVDDEGQPQMVFYGEGVGNRPAERLRGGAFGLGLSRNVRDAYQWLMEHYEDGDAVYIFGFSRGAYTARTLAGLIARCGLLQPGTLLSVAEVFERYRKDKKEAKPIHELRFDEDDGRPISDEDQALLDNSRRIDIEFIGVWDTVGALGVPFGKIRGWSRRTFSFHNTNPSTLYKHMRHAVAIDEHRKDFDATLWTGYQPEGGELKEWSVDQIEQRWFVGDHCNVGGGHRSDPLALVPLAWLQAEAAACGLAFKRTVVPPEGAELAPHHDSFATFAFGLYRWLRLFQRHYREIGRPPRLTDKGGLSHVLNETIDGSVLARWRDDSRYRPRRLAEWAELRGVEPAELEEGVVVTV